MQLTTLADLRALYGPARERSVKKELPQLDVHATRFIGLSPLLVEEMFALIQKINREGQSILLMEQNAVQTLAIAHRAYIIENGRVAMQGPSEELARDPDLRRNYLWL